VNKVPAGWAEATVGELIAPGRALAYGVLKPGEHSPGGVLLLKGYQVRDGFIDTSDQFLIARQLDEEFSRTRLRGGEVLLTVVGSVGRSAVAPMQLAGANVSRAIAVVPVAPHLGQWIHTAFRTPQVQAVLAARTGGTAQPVLNLGEVRELSLPLPPLNEQRRIVAKLEALQSRGRRAREALDAVPPLLEKLRQSILAAAFRGDLTKDWRAKNRGVEPANKLLERIRVERRRKWEEGELARMNAKGRAPKDDEWKGRYKQPEAARAKELPALPEGWGWARLDELAEVRHGYAFESRDFGDTGPIVLTPGNFTAEGELDFGTKRVVRHTGHFDAEWVLRGGDLLVVMTDLSQRKLILGSAVILDSAEVVLHNQRIGLVMPHASGIDRGFLRLAMLRPQYRQRIKDTATGTLIAHTSPTRLLDGLVPLAPLGEQQEVVRRVTDASRVLGHLADALESGGKSFASLTCSILSKAFRGELVPQEPNDEPAEAMLSRLRVGTDAATGTTKGRRRPKPNDSPMDDRSR
jgi:type I restriction enzyme S subunit